MDPSNFFQGIAESVSFLIAFGSIIGLLGIIFGFISLVIFGKSSRKFSFTIILFSIILLVICGPTTGIEYFHIGI